MGTLAPTAALTIANRVLVTYKVGSEELGKGYDVGFKSATTDPADRSPLETLVAPETDAAASAVKYAIESGDITKTW